MRIGLIVNSNARGVLRDPTIADRLARVLDGQGEVRTTRRPEEVSEAIARFALAGAEAIALCGGDGAAMFAATALSERPVALPLALLPGGTMNTLCRNLGIRGRPEAVLARLMRAHDERGSVPGPMLPTIRVDGRVGFLFGAGLVGNFFDVYYASPNRGRLYAAAQVTRIVLGALVRSTFSRRVIQPVDAEVEVDGRRLPWREFTVFAAGTVENVGVGLRVLHRAAERDDAFHFIASGLAAVRMAPQIPRLLRGRPLGGPRHHDGLTARAVIRFARPSPYILDGEPFEASELRLEPGPSLHMVVA